MDRRCGETYRTSHRRSTAPPPDRPTATRRTGWAADPHRHGCPPPTSVRENCPAEPATFPDWNSGCRTLSERRGPSARPP
jgi:hypothetical protein